MTAGSLRTVQPDLARGGRFFSGTVIFLGGMLVFGALLGAALAGPGEVLRFGREVLEEGREVYAGAGRVLLRGVAAAAGGR